VGNHSLILTIVAAPDGVLRTSILSFLRAIPAVSVVALTSRADRLPDLVRETAADVLVLDADLCSADGEALLGCLRDCRPGLNTIVHSNSLPQLDRLRAAGARHTLLKGFQSDHLRRAVLDRGSAPMRNDASPRSDAM
jgi:DNA-binding NarL/FixJ family response regulator